MLHIDIPTPAQVEKLASAREPGCVSIYLPTGTAPSEMDATRIDLKNLVSAASAQLRESGTTDADISAIESSIDDLVADVGFWASLSNSLAIFATARSIRTFRLPHRLQQTVEVSDRFHIKPLMRALTFPQSAFVLAIAQKSARLIAITADQEPKVVDVPGLPDGVVSPEGAGGRSLPSRMEGAEGHKVRIRQFARDVDRALRSVLSGQDLPLIVAAAAPLDSAFAAVNSYPHLVDAVIAGNPEEVSDAALAASARVILDDVYARDLAALTERMANRMANGRAVTDLGDIARAATFGAIDTLFVDIDESLPGSIDESSGEIEFADAASGRRYGVVDEIVRRAILSHAKIFAVHAGDVPGGGAAAASLRFAV